MISFLHTAVINSEEKVMYNDQEITMVYTFKAQ